MNMKLWLTPNMFTASERLLLESDEIAIYTFTYESGVEALRIEIGRSEIVWLPFLGQQIWSWKLDGVEQKFEGFVAEPTYYASNFLENYGAFMLHCGITAMGNPSKQDSHLHHGELPLSRFREALVEVCEGSYPLVLRGTYHHHIPFKATYDFSPSIHISGDGSSMHVQAKLYNKLATPLQYLYLNHLNFSKTNAKSLEYANKDFSPQGVTIIGEAIANIQEDCTAFLDVSKLDNIAPELVAIMKNPPQYGKVCINRMHQKETAVTWMAVDTDSLDHTVAWLSHTPDRSACGFSLPATAGPRGLAEETRLGNVKTLEPGRTITFQFIFGCDEKGDETKMNDAITRLGGSL